MARAIISTASESIVYQGPRATKYNDSSLHFRHAPNLGEVNNQMVLYKLKRSAKEAPPAQY